MDLFGDPACARHDVAHEYDHQWREFPTCEEHEREKRDAQDIPLGAAEEVEFGAGDDAIFEA